MLCFTPQPLHGGYYRGVICAARYTKHKFIVRIRFQPVYNYYIDEEVHDMRIDITHEVWNLHYELHHKYIDIWDDERSNRREIKYSNLFHSTDLLCCYIRYLIGKYCIRA